MASQQITIGPEFFAKAKNDYERFGWALIREFMQNSMDCGSDVIEIFVAPDFDSDDNEVTQMAVTNNGNPMTHYILVNKLLCLGGSGKNFNNSVGGFGKAKELLYYMHNWYTIESGNLHVHGAGAGYNLTETEESLCGTRSTIEIAGDHVEEIVKATRLFAQYAQWSGEIILRSPEGTEHLQCNTPKGTRRRDIDFGVIYTNKSDTNVCVVRIGGIPMFYQYCGIDRMVIVELNGKSIDVLTSNRDGLVYPYRGQLSQFVTELSTDRRSALKERVTQYERYAGAKLGHRNSKPETTSVGSMVIGSIAKAALNVYGNETHFNVEGLEGSTLIVTGDQDSDLDSDSEDYSDSDSRLGSMICSALGTPGTDGSRSDRPVRMVRMNQEFIIKNESGMAIPDYYRPCSPEFSDYSRKLVRMWGRLMLEMHRLFDHEDDFAIGFIFDEDTVAEHERSSDYGRVYYISPSEIVEQSNSKSKSFKKRWKLDNAGKKMMLSVAAHEFVHGLGFSYHSDAFAAKYTEVMGKVMANIQRFTWCYRA